MSRHLAATVLTLVVSAACWRATPSVAQPCEPVAGALPVTADATLLAGEFRVALVADAGARAGERTGGVLRLRTAEPGSVAPRPADPAHPAAGARYPLYGSADIALGDVGAVAPGELGVESPRRPGVRAVEWESGTPATRQFTLRLGADANDNDRLLFDGASMALHVRAIGPDSFAGTWTSGTGGAEVASGYFCAFRSAGG